MDLKEILTGLVVLESIAYSLKAFCFMPVLLDSRKYGLKEGLSNRCNLGFQARYGLRRMLLPFPIDFLYIAYDHLKVDYLLKKKGIDGRIGDPIVDEMLLKQSNKFY